MPVAGAFPTVAGDLVRPTDPAGREHDRFRLEQLEPPVLALVPERPGDPIAVLQQRDDRALHVHVHALVNPVVLQRSDHLKAGAVADMRETRVAMPAEVSLEDPPVLRAV